ncbi:MAG: ABC transporter ATP-binding protein [Bdellovibrionaceae bacterium]|nr:ABC transporter ATP-binding protein [Bdellovibrionales bacterium]MCB9253487.1 ABC transporter ATP-binding protein [Pseudobdellovibrionaceae bacterium]
MSATVNVSEIFKIEHVTIAYGWRKFVAVESLNLHLEKGGSLALLGLNGAGKTSTIRLLMGMVRPQIGQVEIFGTRPGDLKALARIGFAPEEATPPEYLKGEEYLDFVASFRLKGREARKKAVSDLMQWFEMPAQRRIRDYSKGMRRKLILAQALIGDPELLILDEPLNGLDPLFIMKLRERVEGYVKNGGSLLLSSHILAEVEKVCTSVAIIREGQVAFTGSSAEAIQQYGSIEKAFAHFVGRDGA